MMPLFPDEPLNDEKKQLTVMADSFRMQTLNSSTLCLLPSPEAREMAFLLHLICRHQKCAHFTCACIFVYVYLFAGIWEGNGRTRL